MDTETGQVASRAVPVPGPMVDQGPSWAPKFGPPKIFLGRWLPGGRSGSADARGRSGVDSVSSWTKADTPRLGTALLAVTRELDSLGLGTALLAVTRELDSPGRGDRIPGRD